MNNSRPEATNKKPLARRHGRRPVRSSITGHSLLNPYGRVNTFKVWAGAVIQFLTNKFPAELFGVQIGFATGMVPKGITETQQSYDFYTIDRAGKEIIFHRMPIQRFRGLHVNDEDHRRMFVEHIVYRAICDYLEVETWELLPGYFEHY